MVNKVILIGNVGIDPEVRTLENGTKVARVRLATTERIFDRQANETKEHTEWHSITLWRGMADVVDRYVHKGTQLYVEGRLRTREWTDKEGNKRYTTEILADTMNLLGRRGDNNAAAPSDGAGYGQPQGGRSNYGSAPARSASQGAASPQTQSGYGSQPAYQAPRPAAGQPSPAAAPSVPADDPDDLPF